LGAVKEKSIVARQEGSKVGDLALEPAPREMDAEAPRHGLVEKNKAVESEAPLSTAYHEIQGALGCAALAAALVPGVVHAVLIAVPVVLRRGVAVPLAPAAVVPPQI